MPAPRLPLRARAAVVVVAVLGVLALGAGTAAVQVGSGALRVGGGFVSSNVWTSDPQWAGIEVRNRTDFPVTLRAVEARVASNARVLDARVIRPTGSHLGQLSAPGLTPDIRAAIDAGVPVDGFVLPPHSGDRYQVAIEFAPRSTGQASISSTAVVYTALGLDHGAVSDGVYCVRAPGKGGCPPF